MVSKRRPPSSHGVWSVVLLMYTNIVHTALTVLHCHNITNTQGDSSAVSMFKSIVINNLIGKRFDSAGL